MLDVIGSITKGQYSTITLSVPDNNPIPAYLVYQTIPLVFESKRLTVELPNTANFAFSFYHYLLVHLSAIVLGTLFNKIRYHEIRYQLLQDTLSQNTLLAITRVQDTLSQDIQSNHA